MISILIPKNRLQLTSVSGLREAKPEEQFQFERHGYFIADRLDSTIGKPIFNRTVTLRDSWDKEMKKR